MLDLNAFFDELADRFAARVVSRLREGEPGMIDQGASPLGPKRHCAAVRRRLGRGQLGAAKLGRRYLLSAEALAEELQIVSRSTRESGANEVSGNVTEELRRELALIRGGRS